METALAPDLVVRIRRIRLLTCDVDGVLTDARIFVDDHGRELKAYSAQDGQGIKMLLASGVAVAWITGSRAESVVHRARQLGVAHVMLGADNKIAPWERLRGELGIAAEASAHIGDDLPDVPLFNQCGFAVAVPHAPDSVQARAHYVTRRDGGCGAVREVCELILAVQERLAPQLAAYGA
jgi:3-deoxy-D-manno-octulosonate 8-phosphate phosphatase (KDO 8-P phosphatase)